MKMLVSGIVYYGSLILCISLGNYYKNIGGANMKRNYGTGLGVLLALLIRGHYIYHSLLMVWVNIVIIKCCDRRYMHQLSLAYTWIYMLYLHYNVKDIYIIWLHQVQALKLVGLAFEICGNKVQNGNITNAHVDKNDVISKEPSTAEIVAYSYCFIGLHKGPYFRWKIYADHFNQPYSSLVDCSPVTELQIKKACVCAFIYLLLRTKYSPKLYKNPIFYQKYGADFRFLYNIPMSIMYILRYQGITMLCTSVCTGTGFGVYPAKSKPISGYGPSNHNLLTETTTSSDVAEDLNFSSLQCFSNKKILLGPKMRDTISGWDMPTRYWFWSHVYKGLLSSNKDVRSALSFIACTVWCGPTLPNVILASTLWVYIQLESEYIKLYNTSSMKLPWDIGFSIMRLFCLLYLTPCLVVDDTSTVLKYYNSIFWVYHFILLVLMVVAVVFQRFNKS